MQAMNDVVARVIGFLMVAWVGFSALAIAILFRAFVIQWGWNRFGVLLGAPEIGLAMAYGIMLMASLLVGRLGTARKVRAEDQLGFWDQIGRTLFACAMAWLLLAITWVFV